MYLRPWHNGKRRQFIFLEIKLIVFGYLQQVEYYDFIDRNNKTTTFCDFFLQTILLKLKS